jgi:hypothetical protein
MFWVRLIFQREVQFQLARPQTGQQRIFWRQIQPGHRAQQHRTVGPQTHLPSQAQAVEKHLAQTQLAFLGSVAQFVGDIDEILGWRNLFFDKRARLRTEVSGIRPPGGGAS